MSTSMTGPRPLVSNWEEGRDWAAELAPLGARQIKVVIDVSNKCNLRCRMCHFAYDEVFYRPADYMKPELFARIAEQSLPKAHTLILSAGNEPLTSPWFADILKIAAPYEVPNVLFITNGTRLTKTIANAVIEAGVNQIQVSIDGSTKETYESIRRGAKFERLVANLAYLRDEKRRRGVDKPHLQFNIVLMRSNLEELLGFVDLAEELDVEWIAARHLLVMAGLEMENETLFGDPERANLFFQRFIDHADRSSSVDIISFPDFFDVEAMRAASARRLFQPDTAFGATDTPAAGAPVSDFPIQFSGWALDSERLVGVTIEREAFQDEGPETLNERGLVHVMDARIGGERTDVAALFPDFATASRSGWSAEVRRADLPRQLPLQLSLSVWAFSLGRPARQIGACKFIGGRPQSRARRRKPVALEKAQ